MNRRLSFDDALNASIDAMLSGRPMAAALDAHARYAPALEPLLHTAAAINAAAPAVPQPARLGSNYAAVRSALRDARSMPLTARRSRSRTGAMTSPRTTSGAI
jgi:hypothetical protein